MGTIGGNGARVIPSMRRTSAGAKAGRPGRARLTGRPRLAILPASRNKEVTHASPDHQAAGNDTARAAEQIRTHQGAVAAVSLLGVATIAATTRLQRGVVKQLPDTPLRRFNLRKVSPSDEAYSDGGPDSPINTLAHAFNLVLASTVSPTRARTLGCRSQRWWSRRRNRRSPPNAYSTRCRTWTRRGAPTASSMRSPISPRWRCSCQKPTTQVLSGWAWKSTLDSVAS